MEIMMKSILDPTFRYTKSIDTDIRKTFARIRREQQKQARAHASDGQALVLPLEHRKVRAVA
jgi:hypothetical protein